MNTTAPNYSSLQVCSGTTINQVDWFLPTGAVYEWYTTPSSQTPLPVNTSLQSGVYYVGRNHYGCKSSRAMVQVTVFDIPNAPTGESIQTIASPATISDIQMNESNILWYTSYNNAVQHANVLSSSTNLVDGTTYYGMIQNQNGCYSLPTAVTINLYLGLDELDKSNLKVYPNPTTDVVNIEYNETIDSIELYSLLGQKVYEAQTKDTKITIPLEHLSSGTYMMKITVGFNTSYVKIIKK